MASQRTISDFVAHHYDNQIPVNIGGRSVVLQTRDDVHEWLAQAGIDSTNAAHMSQSVPSAEPASVPMTSPEAQTAPVPEWTQEAATRQQYEQARQPIEEAASAASDYLGNIGTGLGEGIQEAIGGYGDEFGQVTSAMRPDIERAERQALIGFAPTVEASRRPLYRGRPLAPPGVIPQAESGRQERQRLAFEQATQSNFLEDFIREQPDLLSDGSENPFKRLAAEELERITPSTMDRVARDAGTVAMQAVTGRTDDPMLGPSTGSIAYEAADTLMEVPRTMATAAGTAFGVTGGALTRAADAAFEGAKRLPSAAQSAAQSLSVGDVPPTPMEGLPYMGLEGQVPPEGAQPETDGILGSGWQDFIGQPAADRDERERFLAEMAKTEPLSDLPPIRKTEHVVDGLSSAYAAMEDLAESRMDMDTLQNMRSDISDLMSVIPTLATAILSVPEEELQQKGMGDRFSMALRRTSATGVTLTDSALAGMAFVLANPMRALHTMPVSTLLTFADVLIAIKSGVVSPAMNSSAVKDALKKIESVTDKWVPLIENKLPGTAKAMASVAAGGRELRSTWRQSWGDLTYNTNPNAWLFGDEVVRRAKQESEASRASLEDLGRAIGEFEDAGQPKSLIKETKKKTYDTEFEEFDKNVLPSGKIDQPLIDIKEDAARAGYARTPRGRTAQGSSLPVGRKGGARVRKAGKDGTPAVRKVSLWGEARKVRDELVQFYQERSGTGRVSYSADDIDRAISEAVSFVVPNTILMSKTLRERVISDAKRWASNKDIHGDSALSGKELNNFLKNVRNEVTAMASRDKVEGVKATSNNVYNLRLKLGDWDGGTFSVVDDSLMRTATEIGAEGLRRQIFAEAITAMAGRAAARSEQTRRQLSVARALESFGGSRAKRDKKTGALSFSGRPDLDVALNRVERALKETKALPAAIRVDGGVLADLAKSKWADLDTIHTVPKQRVLRELRSYGKIDSEVTLRELGLVKRQEGDVRRVSIDPMYIEGGIWANPSTRRTMNWWARDIDSLSNTNSWHRFGKTLKRNLTAANPSTHVNNLVSNAVIQGLRRGEPLHIAKVLNAGKEYKAFLSGKMTDPAKREMYRALRRTGALKSDVVRSELQAMGRAEELMEKGVLPHHTLERVYAWGDNVFKLEEGVRNYKSLKADVDKLGDGEWIQLNTGRAKEARVMREGGKYRVTEGVPGAVGAESKSYLLSKGKLNDLVANAAMKPALDLFFDYGDVPLIARVMRSVPIAQAFAAPFYSWFSKALTMPFAGQPGVMGHMLSSKPGVRTNNPKVIAAQMADAVMASARKSLVANSARQEFMDNRDAWSMQLGGYGFKMVPSVMLPVMSASNPLYFEFRNLEYMSPSQPADALLRLAQNGLGTFHLPLLADAVMRTGSGDFGAIGDIPDAFFSPRDIDSEFAQSLSDSPIPGSDEDIEALGSEWKASRLKVLRNVWRRSSSPRGLEVATDAIELVGASGGLLADFVTYAASEDKTDRETGRLWDTFTALIFPGLYAKAFDVGAGAAFQYANEPSDWEEGAAYRWRKSPHFRESARGLGPFGDPEEQFMRWGIRRILGIGLSPTLVGDTFKIKGGKRIKDVSGASSKMINKLSDRLRESMRSVGEKRLTAAVDSWNRLGSSKSKDSKGYQRLMLEVRRFHRMMGDDALESLWKKEGYGASVGRNPIRRNKYKGIVGEEIEAIKRRWNEPIEAIKSAIEHRKSFRFEDEDAVQVRETEKVPLGK